MIKQTSLIFLEDARDVRDQILFDPVRVESFKNFKPDPGYLYVAVRALSSRVNANYDGWSVDELKKSYKTFLGRPAHVEHHNWDYKKAKGIIVDVLYKEHKTASGMTDAGVYLLIEVDAQTFPRLAKSIVSGKMKGVSMGCFVPGTPITLSDGSRKNIENIEVGDLVLTHKGNVEPVTYVMEKQHNGIVYDVRTFGQSEPMILTEEHPVWVKRIREGWVNAQDLLVGDLVLTPKFQEDGLWRRITSINIKNYQGPVYNFDVDGDDSYVAANIAVHNCDVDYTTCSVCGHKASMPHEYCFHVGALKGQNISLRQANGQVTSGLVYENCHGVNFFEISFVFDPADESCWILDHKYIN